MGVIGHFSKEQPQREAGLGLAQISEFGLQMQPGRGALDSWFTFPSQARTGPRKLLAKLPGEAEEAGSLLFSMSLSPSDETSFGER